MYKKLCTQKIDEFGRININQEIRNILGIRRKQLFDVFVNEDAIVLKPNNTTPMCALCGESDIHLNKIGYSLLCNDCIEKIKEITKTQK
ncbi:hypothetical protein SDC9_186074 [bioreactor metagenome]|uniref:SpoVT-AbrB domain-containing protein n=1 Tax=bioreactor metagenome TaxID=1076179 RepID=A0A645HIH7_9ZZZZ